MFLCLLIVKNGVGRLCFNSWTWNVIWNSKFYSFLFLYNTVQNDTPCYCNNFLLLFENYVFLPPLHRRGVYCFTSVRLSFYLSNIFFSATIDGRNLIFNHKLHIDMPYCGKLFWTHQIPTSCFRLSWFLYTLNIYAHFSSHFSQQLLMAEIWYLVTSFI